MKKEKIFTIILAILVFAVAATAPVYAWFFSKPEGVTMIKGDIKIAVDGWAKVLPIEEVDNVPMFSVEDKLLSFNNIDNFNYSQYIAFRFKVENLSDRDAVLSLRLNPFMDMGFIHFIDYYNANGAVSPALHNAILVTAQKNTFKFVYKLSQMSYEYYDDQGVVIKEDNFADNGLWRYSAGEYIFENIPLKGRDSTVNPSIFLNFAFVNSQDPQVLENYYNWLCIDDGMTDEIGSGIGFGQRRCARMLGSNWDALSTIDQGLIDGYLAYFIDQETQSIKAGAEGVSIVNFNLDYFEFNGSIGFKA